MEELTGPRVLPLWASMFLPVKWGSSHRGGVLEDVACTLVLEDPTPPGRGKGRKQRGGYPAGAREGGAEGIFPETGQVGRIRGTVMFTPWEG